MALLVLSQLSGRAARAISPRCTPVYKYSLLLCLPTCRPRYRPNRLIHALMTLNGHTLPAGDVQLHEPILRLGHLSIWISCTYVRGLISPQLGQASISSVSSLTQGLRRSYVVSIRWQNIYNRTAPVKFRSVSSATTDQGPRHFITKAVAYIPSAEAAVQFSLATFLARTNFNGPSPDMTPPPGSAV